MWHETQKGKTSQGLVLSSLGPGSWGFCTKLAGARAVWADLGQSLSPVPLLRQGMRRWGSLHLPSPVGTKEPRPGRREGGGWRDREAVAGTGDQVACPFQALDFERVISN